ncbi:hypothetical protein [Microtetraspora sp. NBRC 16547]
MAKLLGDPEVMRYYPRPYTHDELVDLVASQRVHP